MDRVTHALVVLLWYTKSGRVVIVQSRLCVIPRTPNIPEAYNVEFNEFPLLITFLSDIYGEVKKHEFKKINCMNYHNSLLIWGWKSNKK